MKFFVLSLPTIKSIFYSNESNKTISYPESVTQKCSMKKVFVQNFQNWQENTCAKFTFFNKVAGLWPATLLRKRLWHRCFPVNFARFLRTPFFLEHLWLLFPHQSISPKYIIPKYKYPQNKYHTQVYISSQSNVNVIAKLLYY